MDYKSTLNLPTTSFPMKANLPQREPEWLATWARERLYDRIQELGAGRPLFILHDGPPYANGRIHIGHALNKILKDFIVKSKTMSGYRVPFIPGWDCHGLPIEHQVTKELGPKKSQLSIIELRRLCRAYADRFYRIQREEFQRLGVLGDWEHPYLTMNPDYESTILREFATFVEKGMVYKGLKPVLWCTVDQTALAEAEVEYETHRSTSIYVKFPFELSPSQLASPNGLDIPELATASQVSMVIWTTTPWTLPANQALAIHPDITYAFVRVGDEILVIAEKQVESVVQQCRLPSPRILATRQGRDSFEGLRCRRPLSDGLSPILLADFVTLDQGTGCVHIAPGHGMEDYLLVLRYNAQVPQVLSEPLSILVPVDDTGRFTHDVQEFAGQHVLQANPQIVAKLQDLGLLVGTQEIEHAYPHCWRCKQPVIFRATQQWFVSMEKGNLRERALKEIDQVRWYPPRGRDRIYGMILNRPDWCLSRQRTWGTPIPGFTCTRCQATLMDPALIRQLADLVGQQGSDVWFERSPEELLPAYVTCPSCGNRTFHKERDIVDVWFESGVSHAAVLKPRGPGWWPADLYLEGSDQHRGWFHSALLTAVTTDDRAPYKAVLTHGFVVDGEGKKMSKSAGNVVTPQEVIQQSGAEILRLWVASQDYHEDLRISSTIIKQLSEAYRKIRNTCRFLLSNLYDFEFETHAVPYDHLSELDRWALTRLAHLIAKVRQGYDAYEFRQAFHELEYFCTVDMSATYLDMLKDRLYTFPKHAPLRRGSQTVLFEIIVVLAKLMAPILAFTADEIWRTLPDRVRESEGAFSIHLVRFPTVNPRWINPPLEQNWKRLLAVRTQVQSALEQQRRNKLIGSSLEAKVILHASDEMVRFLQKYHSELPTVFIVSQVELRSGIDTHAENLVTDATLGIQVEVRKADGQKCERCWNYRLTVGSNPDHPTLCDRCLEAIG
ncbi:MAG: isoleucine--tRNA ligase [Nitrospirae bacterium]|nr:MAG: isoleucine--tRNA ligase [Nitrospirota bacterium]